MSTPIDEALAVSIEQVKSLVAEQLHLGDGQWNFLLAFLFQQGYVRINHEKKAFEVFVPTEEQEQLIRQQIATNIAAETAAMQVMSA